MFKQEEFFKSLFRRTNIFSIIELYVRNKYFFGRNLNNVTKQERGVKYVSAEWLDEMFKREEDKMTKKQIRKNLDDGPLRKKNYELLVKTLEEPEIGTQEEVIYDEENKIWTKRKYLHKIHELQTSNQQLPTTEQIIVQSKEKCYKNDHKGNINIKDLNKSSKVEHENGEPVIKTKQSTLDRASLHRKQSYQIENFDQILENFLQIDITQRREKVASDIISFGMHEHQISHAQIKQAEKANRELNQNKSIRSIIGKEQEQEVLFSESLSFHQFLRQLNNNNLVQLYCQAHLVEKKPLENVSKFLILMSFIRKHNILSNYNREDIHTTINTILKYIDQMTPIEICSFTVNLDKMRINKIEFFKILEKKILEKAHLFDLRSIANIVHSFAGISSKQTLVEDFSEIYKKFENIIAIKLHNKSPSDICQIIGGYSKAQTFSREFLYTMEAAVIELFDYMNPQELAIIAHSFAKNNFQSDNFLDKLSNFLQKYNSLESRLIKDASGFKIKELALISESFENFIKLDKGFLRVLEDQFLLKSQQANAQDIAIFFKIFFSFSDQDIKDKTKDKLLENCEILFNNIDQNSLRKMFYKFSQVYNEGKYNERSINFLLRRFNVLIKDEEIRGGNFDYIIEELKKIKNDNKIKKIVHKITVSGQLCKPFQTA